MAHFDMTFDENYLRDLLETDVEDIAREALDSAAPILAESIGAAIREEGHVDSGELANSITCNKAKKSSNGAWIVNAYPKGYSTMKKITSKSGQSRQVSNAAKLIWIEYGINGRQPPRPFMVRATGRAKEKVLQAMQERYSRKVGAG